MNLRNHYLVGLLLVLFVFPACQEQIATQESKGTEQEVQKASVVIDQPEEKKKLLRHIVIFKFKEESSEEDINKLNEEFNALAKSIPVVQDFEWGLNNSPEDFHQGFTHCYLITFNSEKDRDEVYAPHPEHQAFVKNLQPHLEKVFVVDYWTNP